MVETIMIYVFFEPVNKFAGFICKKRNPEFSMLENSG